ncbi:MAG: hypothetical protein QOE83_113 [Actinomycetota bacterium]|jgi:hypothetical protein|nr:hypothetical protein [Actinomycetota bacterium]
MGTARKGKALGWGIVAIVLLGGAGVSFTRPAATPIPVAHLEAASATDAGTLALVIPGKFADRRLSLQEAGTVPATVTEIATQDGVTAVRLWSTSGVLLASSDPADAALAGPMEKPLITAAQGATAEPGSMSGGSGLLRIFEPVSPDKPNAVVAEFVRSTSDQGLPFKAIAAGLAALGLLALILALASLRGASSPKVPVAAPQPIDTDAPPAPGQPSPHPQEAGGPAADPKVERDSGRLVQKLKNSEASRAAMETQLEQLRAQLRMGTQGSEQVVAEMDRSLASSQQRAHEAGEQLALAEAARKEAEQRAAVAEEALSRATPSDAAERLVAVEAEFAAAQSRIAELEGIVAEHQARTRDAEARSGEAEKRSTVVTNQVAEHEARATEVEGRQAELENRAGSAEARATQAERALADAVQHAADLEMRVTNAEAAAASVVAATPTPGLGDTPTPGAADVQTPDAATQGSDAQLQLELARAQDLAEQALAKLETVEIRAAKAEAAAAAVRGKLADAESRMRDAEARAAVAGAPTRRRGLKTSPPPPRTPDAAPADLSLADSSTPIAAPVHEPVAAPSAEPTPPVDPAPVPESQPELAGDSAAPAEEAPPSATDPGAWKALAKSLRREALGDQAPEEIEDEAPEIPGAPVTPDDRSELRARLAKASARKRRKIE